MLANTKVICPKPLLCDGHSRMVGPTLTLLNWKEIEPGQIWSDLQSTETSKQDITSSELTAAMSHKAVQNALTAAAASGGLFQFCVWLSSWPPTPVSSLKSHPIQSLQSLQSLAWLRYQRAAQCRDKASKRLRPGNAFQLWRIEACSSSHVSTIKFSWES